MFQVFLIGPNFHLCILYHFRKYFLVQGEHFLFCVWLVLDGFSAVVHVSFRSVLLAFSLSLVEIRYVTFIISLGGRCWRRCLCIGHFELLFRWFWDRVRLAPAAFFRRRLTLASLLIRFLGRKWFYRVLRCSSGWSFGTGLDSCFGCRCNDCTCPLLHW